MPPKSKKIISKDETSSSESEVSEKEVRKPTRRIIVAKKDREEIVKKEKEESKKKVEIVADKWNEISSDDDHIEEKHVVKDESSSSEEEIETTKKSFVKKVGAKYTTSSINFDYGRFRDGEIKLNELSTEDIIKAAIVRAHDDNQYQLGKVLKQTVRGMKLECDFPIVGLTRDQIAGGKPKQYSNNYDNRMDRVVNGPRIDHTDRTSGSRSENIDREYRGRNTERGGHASTRGRSQSRFGGIRRTEL
jgi:hypothetical protein